MCEITEYEQQKLVIEGWLLITRDIDEYAILTQCRATLDRIIELNKM